MEATNFAYVNQRMIALDHSIAQLRKRVDDWIGSQITLSTAQQELGVELETHAKDIAQLRTMFELNTKDIIVLRKWMNSNVAVATSVPIPPPTGHSSLLPQITMAELDYRPHRLVVYQLKIGRDGPNYYFTDFDYAVTFATAYFGDEPHELNKYCDLACVNPVGK